MILSRKLAALIVDKKVSIDDVVSSLSAYHLLPLLPNILKAVKQSHSDSLTSSTILIETPYEMSPTSVAHIKRIIGNDLAEHEVTINKHLLAGFKARFKGRLYDGSAERIIKQFIKEGQN